VDTLWNSQYSLVPKKKIVPVKTWDEARTETNLGKVAARDTSGMSCAAFPHLLDSFAITWPDASLPQQRSSSSIIPSSSMSSTPNYKTEESTQDVPEAVPETKNVTGDTTDDATTATIPDAKSKPQGEENYLDDTPTSSQKESKKSTVKTAAKPEAAAHTGEKRQRR
jgi:hypothetical protein